MTGDTKGNFSLYRRDPKGPYYVGTVRLSTGTTDLRKAREIRDEMMHEVRHGRFFQHQKMRKYTWENLLERFLTEHAPTVEEGTRKFYGERLEHLTAFFSGRRLVEIDVDLVSQYVRHRRIQSTTAKTHKCSASTRNRELAVLGKMFALAKKWKWVQSNPCEDVARETESRDGIGRPLTESEELALYAACSEDLADFILLFIYTGIRRGQGIKMMWEDINMDSRILNTVNEKTNEPYLLHIQPVVHDMLLRRAQKGKKGLVFSVGDGKPYDGQNLLHAFQRACLKVGLPKLRIHDLRHTTGARLAALGKDINFIAHVLNHSQLSTTRRYAKHNLLTQQKGLDMMSAKRVEDGNLCRAELHTTCTQTPGEPVAEAESVAVTD